MQDRVPLYPGRVKLTPVAGQENVYDMVRADQPTQEGTPLNKNSLLKDATAALFQLSGDTALPDKVFEILSKAALVEEDGSLVLPDGSGAKQAIIGSGKYTGTGTYGQSNPNSVSLNGKPEFFAVFGADTGLTANTYGQFVNGFIWIAGQEKVITSGSQYRQDMPIFASESEIRWYAPSSYGDSADAQLNVSGKTYVYFYVVK